MTDLTNMMVLTKQSGILKPFAIVLGWIMEGIFWVLDKLSIPNTGLAIIIFTIVIYILLLPLTIKQQKFSKLSAKMNPELNAIRAKYNGKNDQESMQKMNAETQLIYQKYGVSPTGSCLPLLVQMPILFALYRVIYNMPAYVGQIKNAYSNIVEALIAKSDSSEFMQTLSSAATYTKQFSNESFGVVEEYTSNTYIDVLNRASSADWASISEKYPDLSQTVSGTLEVLEKYNNFLGLNIANSPSFTIRTEWASDERNWALIIGVILIPVLSCITQWINTKLMPQPDNSNKKKNEDDAMASSLKTMNTIMPLTSAFFCFTLPVGMGIYWIAGSVVRGVIQVCINKHMDKIDIDEMIKQNVEKANEKRKKLGLPPQQLVSNATLNTKSIESKPVYSDMALKAGKNTETVKESTEYYNNANVGKQGSLASKAFMVKQYNEKNNK